MEDNLEALREIYENIIKDEVDVDEPLPVGKTGDPDCPYRDWRGTPLEVGATVVWPGGTYNGGTLMKQGIVVDIIDKPEKKYTPENWKFMVRCEIQEIASNRKTYQEMQLEKSKAEGKPKRQGVLAVEKITVVF